MKAVVVKAPGGVEQLSYGDWPDPVIGDDEVLVRVRAAAVNRADVWLRNGLLGALPLVPGIDAAGTVEAMGSGVQGLSTGMRVILNPAVTCGRCEFCLSGRHGICVTKSAIGQRLDGSYAEFVKVPAVNVHRIRDDLSFEEAAAMPSVFFTGWHLLNVRAALQPGETILITAAASGIGSAAVQLAKAFGARVIAAAGSDEKLVRTREWGATETINYNQENLAQRVLELTDGAGAHVILDVVGGSLWPDYLSCIRRGGRIVTCSYVGGREPQVDIFPLIQRQISILGSGPQGSKVTAAKVVDLINQGHLHGVIDRVFPLSDAAEAQTALEGRGVIGKIILVP